MGKAVEKKTKEQIAKAAAAGGKSKKKKWSKGKSKEKANNASFFDQETYDKLLKEIPSQKAITISSIGDKLRITGSLARRAIQDLEAKGLIKPILKHHHLLVYTRAVAAKPAEPAAKGAAKAAPAKGGKKGPAAKKAAAAEAEVAAE
eukprot:TRINITY_DN15509_c0_g1_i1.p1 TRINITY_DN15509_c0_g1~~TRINITY_DN15509_c0_g1_i1.p1  ORF type:complete len:147 (-),score=89.73 TRINITY_DN15509_c0_g1_i1:82-522(-)